MTVIRGTPVCEGIAVGPVHLHRKNEVYIPHSQAENPAAEWEKVAAALREADSRLAGLRERAVKAAGEEQAEIFETHRLILTDGDFLDALKSAVIDGRANALLAVRDTGSRFSALFDKLEDEYMRQRAADIENASALLLEILSGASEEKEILVPSVILADELTPADTIVIERKNILAFVTRGGSANSHTAILAKTMGIPSIIQADFIPGSIPDGTVAAVDGFAGTCCLGPDPLTLAKLAERKKNAAALAREYEAMRGLPSVTLSGRKIDLFANIGGAGDIPALISSDAEGVGLFRSEFLYLGRNDPPGEEAQLAVYKSVAEKMKGKKVVIRTLDIGADKQAGYLRLPAEENPALGCRGIRTCFERPELFMTQLRAIWRASAYGNVAIMFPMICSLWELRRCREFLEEAKNCLSDANIPAGELEVGIMIETPASVLICDELAKEADFFSVGTNDLTQYMLAADRQNQRVSRYADQYHPAVMKSLRTVAGSARAAGIRAGICGDLAADPGLTDTFLEMGYSELSVPPPLILPIRKAVRESRVCEI